MHTKNGPRKWQNPVKNWNVARLIREYEAKLIARQNLEYDAEILGYLNNRHDTGLPFTDFEDEPDQIIQIKKLINSLYLAADAFEKTENFDLSLEQLFTLPQLIEQAYETTQTLVKISVQLHGTYKSEIAALLTLPSDVKKFMSEHYDAENSTTLLGKQDVFSLNAGLTAGRAIHQMRVIEEGESGENGLITYLGAVFPAFPAHLSAARVKMDRFFATNPELAPNMNQEKLEKMLEDQAIKISETIKSCNRNQNIVSLVSNLYQLVWQTTSLWGEIAKDGALLSDTAQDFVRQSLAMYKYELLPMLFAAVDKLEIEAGLKKGRLSKPLMLQVKSWYEETVQYAKLFVKFDQKGEKLLKLEDSRFIELRLAPLHEQIEISKHALEIIIPRAFDALEALDKAVFALEIAEPLDTWDTWFESESWMDLLSSTVKKHFSPDQKEIERHATLQSAKANVKKAAENFNLHFACLKPYLSRYDNQFKTMVDAHLSTDDPDWYTHITDCITGTLNNPTASNKSNSVKELRICLKQLKNDHEFKIKRHESFIASVHKNSNPILFPYNEPDNILAISEKDAFTHRNGLSDGLVFDKKTSNLKNPEKLAPDEAWDLYRWYEVKRADIERAEHDCNELMQAMELRQKIFSSGPIEFHPAYIPCLLENNVPPQPGKMHVNIEGSVLRYTILEPAKKGGCKIHLMPLDKVLSAGHRGCYVWNKDKKQLSYIATNGQVQDNIKLGNTGILSTIIQLRIRRSEKKADTTKSKPEFLAFTDKNIAALITSNGIELKGVKLKGHCPGTIHTATIPLSDLNCQLTKLTSKEQIKPFLPRLFDEALERGHIRDELRTNFIKWYSSLQPYLIGAFKDSSTKDIATFDKKVVELFSGHFHKETPRSSLSADDFNLKLWGLKDILAKEHEELQSKCTACKKLVDKKGIFSLESPLNEGIRHKEFSPDTAEFMISLEPIKREIHESNKKLFKVGLALKYFELYCQKVHPNYELLIRDTKYNTTDEHYPWFQTYFYQLKKPLEKDSAKQLLSHLKQIQFYETEQIKKRSNHRNGQYKKIVQGLPQLGVGLN